jgi:hypothetical protein
MKTPHAALVLAAFLSGALAARGEEAERPLAHMVFFKLAEPGRPAREKLVAACKKHLAGHEGTIHFSVGVLAADLRRDVNDQEFDVALHLVFASKAAHDRYQEHPRHLRFVEENRSLWSKVRVFDSYLEPGEGGADGREGTARLPLPDAASGFAGMVRGQVVAKREDGIVFRIQEVAEEWDHSGAKDSRTLVGSKVLVDGTDAEAVQAFIQLLVKGETVAIDVAHKKGEALTILELTEEQRERVARRRRDG